MFDRSPCGGVRDVQQTWKRVAKAWDQFGRFEPYWGVCSHAQFRASRLTDEALRTFFQSGEEDVARVLTTARQHLLPGFRPTRALDYGCGVGRLVIPLARECAEVVGVDVSQPMIELARRNCADRGLTNVTFALAGGPRAAMADVQGDFDLVHSHLVFQHIPPRLGETIIVELLERLTPGGVGALYVTYGWRAPAVRRALHRVRRSVPLANVAANVLQRRPLRSAMIPMYAYDLGRVLALLQAHGCGDVHALLMEHTGHLGAYLFFRKSDADVVARVPARAPLR